MDSATLMSAEVRDDIENYIRYSRYQWHEDYWKGLILMTLVRCNAPRTFQEFAKFVRCYQHHANCQDSF